MAPDRLPKSDFLRSSRCIYRPYACPGSETRHQNPDPRPYEVAFPDGRSSVFFHWDENPGRRSITNAMSEEEAMRKARDLARTEQDKLDGMR